MHVLVAVDRSEESHNALLTALDVVDAFDGTVTAVHVVDVDDEPRPIDDAGDGEPEPTGSDGTLDDAEELAGERGVPLETEVLSGDPVEAIAAYAERRDVDVVYVGHRGLTGEGAELTDETRGPLGSVARGVIERTQVPVTVFDRPA